MQAIQNSRTFLNDDREWAAMLAREHLAKLLDETPKNYSAIKTIYSLILEEENQDLARRKVELAEREASRLEEPQKKQSASPEEIKRRVRALLGKDSE